MKMSLVARSTLIFLIVILSACASVQPDKAAPLILPKLFAYKNIQYEHPAYAMIANSKILNFPDHYDRGAYLRMSDHQRVAAKTYINAWERCYVTTINFQRNPPRVNELNYRNCGVMLDVMVRLYKQGYDWSQNYGFWSIAQFGNTDFASLVQKHLSCRQEYLIGNAAINEEGNLAFFCDVE